MLGNSANKKLGSLNYFKLLDERLVIAYRYDIESVSGHSTFEQYFGNGMKHLCHEEDSFMSKFFLFIISQ